MKSLLVLGMGLYAAAPIADGMTYYPWTDVGAVTAMGVALLYLLSKTIPRMNKDNNDAHERNTQRQIAAEDKRQQRQIEADEKRDAMLREITLHCSRDKEE